MTPLIEDRSHWATAIPTVTQRRRWLHSAIWLTLLGLFVVCHGCHGDKDDELSLVKEPKSAKTTTNLSFRARPNEEASVKR